MVGTIFTIGHSTHSIDKFLSLLQQAQITAVCDVRSSPFSRFNPQFNRDELKATLSAAGIQYVPLGKELGARSSDSNCYENGQVQYDRLAKTTLFQQGIERLRKGVQGFTLTLMCAEKDPIECHRTILVARELEKCGFVIKHILPDGCIETQDAAIARLARSLKLAEQDLFMTPEEIRDRAYDAQAEVIAHTLDEQKVTSNLR